ncbi:unnamed protein product [Alopecurus aequalis]
MADWSSLPSKLVGRIADCLLDTNDLDCYMDFRAVCPNWRSATDDPKNCSDDLRFRPHRWIIVDEVFQSQSRLLVNTLSGRVVRKELPLLSNYHVIATTHGGFFILADKEPPNAAVVLNPFTGHIIRYKTPVPSYVDVSAASLSGLFTGMLQMRRGAPELFSAPTLFLVSETRFTVYMAVPDSKDFFDWVVEEEGDDKTFILMRLAITGGLRAADSWADGRVAPIRAVVSHKIFSVMKMLDNGEQLEPVKSLPGGCAIFVGYRRCISVSAENFPSIVANCVYYVKSTDSSLDIYKYDLQNETNEWVSEAIDSLNPITLSFASPPFTIVQLLSSYTMNVRESQLAMKRFKLEDPKGAFPQIPFMEVFSFSELDLEDDEDSD